MDRRVVWLALRLTVPAGAGLATIGCGNGDDASVAPAVDGGSDAKADSTTQADVGADSTVGQEASHGNESGTDAGACTLVDTGTLDDASVSAGLDLVANVYKCWKCHQNGPPDAGLTLEGRDASIKDGGLVFPPNLTPDPTGLGCWTNDQVQSAFLKGIAPDGGDLCIMPKYGVIADDAGTEPIDAGTAAQIVQFLRSLSPVAYEAPNTVCPLPEPDGGAVDGGADASDGANAGDGSGPG